MTFIGITGHRFLAEVDRLTAGMDAALHQIREAFPAQEALTVISPLAEGADRLVVQRAIASGAVRLIVPLPLPVDDYLADFATAASREEFRDLLALADSTVALPAVPTREAAYEAAGRYVLEHCDVLIALWDGQNEQGQGGTSALAKEARQRGLPLAWIHAGNRAPGTQQAITLGAEQGQVSYEHFPGHEGQRF
jgi:hypothetical protein